MAEATHPGLGFDPAPGDDGLLDEVAAGWATLAAALADEAAGVRALRGGVLWQGRAATACQQRLHVVPGDLEDAAAACRVAARAVTTFADALRRWRPAAAALEDAAAAARRALATTDEPHVAAHAHEQLTDALRRAARLRDEVEAGAAHVRAVLAEACATAPHRPGWFHRMLHDLSGELHDMARSLHDLVVELAPTIAAIADWCSKAASVLAEVGFLVSLVPGAGDVVGGILVGASIGLSAAALAGHGLLAAEGIGSWRAVAFDGAALTLALVTRGFEEPISAEQAAGEQAAASLPAPWRSMPFMTTKEFALRAVRLHVDGAGAALGTVDLAHAPEDWTAMLGHWRPRARPATG